jgi:hypothetical protein
LQALQDERHKRAAQMRHLQELQASNNERAVRQQAAVEKLEELKVSTEMHILQMTYL